MNISKMCQHMGFIICLACLAVSSPLSAEHNFTNDKSEIQPTLSSLCDRVCWNSTLTPTSTHFEHFCHSCADFLNKTFLENVPAEKTSGSRGEWLYGGLSVLVISGCGLIAVAVIPVLPVHVFQPAVQFLVALAVGSLTGDAVLHLLPHAFMEHHAHDGGHSHERGESTTVWKGVLVLLVITFFFVIERILNIFSEQRRLKQSSKQVAKVKKLVNESSKKLGEELCKKNHHSHHSAASEKIQLQPVPSKTDQENHREAREAQESSCSEWQGLLMGRPLIHCNSHEICDGRETLDSEHIVKIQPTDTVHPEDTLSVVIAEHHTSHHGHSHSHAHIHARPGSVASLAWLVLAGDGLHNLADGLAIGAAFAIDTTSGLTTAIAVLCHELPHELGDFAVLLKAGMTTKQAIVCNLFSSFLCLIGVLVGLGIGSANAVGPWIFAGTAGMFLYIALVDMVPELNVEVKDNKSHWMRLVTQVCGLLCGFAVMLLIALYEHDIKHMLD